MFYRAARGLIPRRCNSLLGCHSVFSRIPCERTRTIHTTGVLCYLYDRMATGQRILVHLQSDTADGSLTKADFTQCIVGHFKNKGTDGLTTTISARLTDNKLVLGRPADVSDVVKIKHPDFCPIHHLSGEDLAALPQEVMSRGIDTGAAVILESADGKILLTRRGEHLRTFPGIWVPPGGHIEENETLTGAGLRELEEETGLEITPDMCHDRTLPVLALWESVFPPKLSLGTPKRHHTVVYLHAKLNSDLDSKSLMSKINVDPGEVGACAWFDKKTIEALVSVREGTEATASSSSRKHLQAESFRALVINEKKEQVESYLPYAPLLQPAGTSQDQRGRVSTGTKFALEEWLAHP